jgi:hypothetical protein
MVLANKTTKGKAVPYLTVVSLSCIKVAMGESNPPVCDSK